jgi:integrin beta 3
VFKSPIVLDRGVYQAGRTYEKGDGATYGGSFWIAQDATSEKPGDGATKWRLAVKAGREGREGKPGKDGGPGPKGEKGDPGRNFS